jgi:uncharacterized membrane protein YbhN (UPF0104 family)
LDESILADTAAPAADAGTPPTATRPRRLIPLLRFGLAAAALFALTRLIHPADIAHAKALVARVGWPLALVLLPTLFTMAMDAAGWRLILAVLGRPVPWRRMLELRLSVEAVGLALPGGSVAAEAIKLALLDRRLGVPIAPGGASLALGKAYLIGAEAIYLAVAAVWLLLGRGTETGQTSAAAGPALAAAGGALVTTLISGTLLIALRQATWVSRIARALMALPSAPLRRWIESRQSGIRALEGAAREFFRASFARRLRCFIPFLFEWVAEAVETWLILRCLAVPLGLGGILGLDAIGSLLRALVFFLPAGLGVQDAAQVLVLSALGVPDAVAVGAAFIFVKRSKEIFWIAAGALFLAVRRDLWQRTADQRPVV